MLAEILIYLFVGEISVRFASKRPNFIKHNSIAPDITGSGEFSILESFRSRPSEGNDSTLCYIVVFIL